jgi:nitrile hydratase subunit beta
MSEETPHPPTDKEGRPRAHHDLGGVSKFMCMAVDTEPHGLTDFDREVDAIRQILGNKGVMSVDELRRGIEAIPEAEYHRLSYYQRWIRSIADTLLQKAVITEAELRAAMDAT